MGYLFEDNEGNIRETPYNPDNWARGRCSGIPDCCIARYDAAGFPMAWEAWEPEDWGYRPCKACVDSGNRVVVKMCADLQDACTCGAWANSKIVEADPLDWDKEEAERLANALEYGAACFTGEFKFVPAHVEDHGIGNIGEFVKVPDRLVFLSDASDEDLPMTVIDDVAEHVAAPIASTMNSVGPAAEQLRAAMDEIDKLREALKLTYEALDNLRHGRWEIGYVHERVDRALAAGREHL